MLTIELLDVAIAQRQRAGEANHETGLEVLLETMWSFHQHRERLCWNTSANSCRRVASICWSTGAIEKRRDAQKGGASW